MNTQDYARLYHSLGWGVLRVYAPTKDGCTCTQSQCSSPGKHPFGGPNAILTSDQIETGNWDNCNVGLTPGQRPTFIVIDIDNKGAKSGGDTVCQWVAEHGKLPTTPTVQTGSGLHLYFKHPDFKISNSVEGLGPGVDVRAKGGFVVAPPSDHASGTQYKWIVDPTTPLADLPDWLQEKLKPRRKPGSDFMESPAVKSAIAQAIKLETNVKVKKAREYLKKQPAAIEGYGGDEQTLKAAGVLFGFALTKDEAWPLLLEYNKHCQPPWSEEDLRKKLDNAYQYHDEEHPFGWLLSLGAVEAERERAEGNIVLDSQKDMTLARWVVDSFGGVDLFKACADRFYHYSKGVWLTREPNEVRGRAHQLHNALVLSEEGGTGGRVNMTAHKTKALEGLIKDMPDVQDFDFLTNTVPGAAFRNGFLDGNTLQITEHKPENKVFDLFDYDYGGDASEWVEFMQSLFIEDEDADAKVELLRGFLGCCILGIATQYPKCLLLTGKGSNGKSTYMEILESMFPPGAQTHIAPKQWKDAYYVAQLQGSKLNSVSEIDEKVIASDVFKQIISGEVTTGRHPYERPLSFTPIAGHIFSANALPATIDNTHGFWRRFAIVQFNRDFTNAKQTKQQVVDRFLDMHGAIAQWAVEGAREVIKRGEYELPKSHFDALGDWRQTADAVSDFVKSCTRPGSGWLKELYHYFKVWAEAEGRGRLGKQQFAKRLEQVYGVSKLTRGAHGFRFDIEMKPSKEWADYSGPTMVERFK